MKASLARTLLGAALLACASAAFAQVKVGFLGTLTGPSGDTGRDQLDGFTLALEQLGGKLGGVPATVVKEDDQQKAEVALSAVGKLIERDKVDVITGLSFANVLVALQAKIAATDVPFVGSVAGPSVLAGAQCKPNLFVTSWQSDAPAEVVGKYLSDKGTKRISTLTPNFVGGRDKVAGLKRFYKGEIVEEMYTPLNQLDFSAELTKIAAAKPEAVYAFYPGGLGVTFVRQYQQSGLLGKIPLYTSNTIEGAGLDAMGAAAVGAVVGDTWTTGQPGEETRRFVEAYRKKYNRPPSPYAAFSYDAAMLLDAAIRSLDGKVGDRKALTKAIAGASFKSLRGPFRFGANNFPVQSYHIYQVASTAGKPELKLLQTDVLKSHADAYISQCPLR
ncbi:ABC transporter substrate-binding protein [Variovorax paradoxus]|nr:ABC transporter substrate-binding protein [Variovorax paradoxus]MBT2304061.1 ABC transporter substrate-binding protein [Variovorax paradoxus]